MSTLLARLNRIQHERGYKLAASIVVPIAILAFIATMWVLANRPEAQLTTPTEASEAPTSIIADGPITALRGVYDTLLLQLHSDSGITPEQVTVVVGALVIGAGAVLVVQLGLSLSYLAALLVGWLVAWPLMAMNGTRDFGLMLFGVVPLILALLTLLQVARLALSGSVPLLAIARNVLAESVRMKVSLIFIVILLLMLSVTPTVLDDAQPLRFRVQQWLTYGLGFSYAVLALLTVFFTVGTVAFEQRDKIIWQTMTKPVRPWEYVLGKWAGVMVLNLILLTVSASGVFMFTEYLRYQPAQGERAYMVDELGNPTRLGSNNPPSEDRVLLENHILAARVSKQPIPYDDSERSLDFFTDVTIARDADLDDSDRDQVRSDLVEQHRVNFEQAIAERMDALRAQADYFAGGEVGINAKVKEAEEAVRKELAGAWRSVVPGYTRVFYFDLREQWREFKPAMDRTETLLDAELQRMIDAGEIAGDDEGAKEQARFNALERLQQEGKIPPVPVFTLRFNIDAGTNDPTATYTVFFAINDYPYPPNAGPTNLWGMQKVALGNFSSFEFPLWLLDRGNPEIDGVMVLRVGSDRSNPRVLTFAPDHLEVVYDAGGYQLNFLRTISMMWLKLAFIAAVGVALSTFLSFPVAALVTLAVLITAEGSGFLAESLQYYATKDSDGNINYFAIPIRAISLAVAWFFEVYGTLKPAESIGDGKLMRWADLARGALWIGVWSTVFMLLGWFAFRRRELAIYSGH